MNPSSEAFTALAAKKGSKAFDFVMKVDGMSFPEAVRMLAERAGIPIEEETRAPNEADRQKKRVDDSYAVNHAAAQFYEAELVPQARVRLRLRAGEARARARFYFRIKSS